MTTPEATVSIRGLGPADTPVYVECDVLTAQIHHGRDDPTTQPAPSTAVIELLGPLPPEAVIGARVTLQARLGFALYPRFVGEITDVRVGWDSVEWTRPQLIATGDLGRIGRRIVGDAPWPAELDGARVSRVLTLAGFAPDPLLSDPGTVTVLARDVDRQPAQAVAHDAASDGGGMLWEDVQGLVRYADAEHRRSAPLGFTFDACDIGLELAWYQSLEGLVNDLSVAYGLAGGGLQPEVHASDPASITESDTFAARLVTRLAAAADAQRRADETIARQSRPAWVVGGVVVELAYLTLAQTQALLLKIDVHSLVKLTGLPAGSPLPEALLWVEGWRESIAPDSWSIAYATSDYCRTAGAAHWDDVAQGTTWDAVDPALIWDMALCLPPATSGGRWDDTDAATRWGTVPSTITWDAWGTGP